MNPPNQPVKPLPKPKKYTTFSIRDSRSLEAAFQKLVEQDTGSKVHPQPLDDGDLGSTGNPTPSALTSNTNLDEAASPPAGVKVAVNEDYLFDVDVEGRELAPAYWLGPIYDVRRGSWFYQEGSTLRPCEENLALQLEEGYLKLRPWKFQPLTSPKPDQSARSRPNSTIREKLIEDGAESKGVNEVARPSGGETHNRVDEASAPGARIENRTQRLFGAYMNSVVTYEDSKIAWILTDDLFSRMSSTVYQRFGYLGGTKVVRGFTETNKPKDRQEQNQNSMIDKKRRSQPPDAKEREVQMMSEEKQADDIATKNENLPPLLKLERQVSSFVTSTDDDGSQEEERARQRDEEEIQNQKDEDGDDQNREIEHLILVTHGIGQRLGLRMESINFIHDVNVFRKTIKNVYKNSLDLQALNAQVETLPKNCRIQVLPISWRHLLDFPKQNKKHNRKEQDLTEVDDQGEDDEYPSLEAITVDGVPAIRNLISDLALDILLYQSAYREHIATIVQQECNRVYNLFQQRNPNFRGRVNLVGHSLGSAIAFDILCRQRDDQGPSDTGRQSMRNRRSNSAVKVNHYKPELVLDFDVDDFFCLGSPLGLYQMLKGRRIAARQTPGSDVSQSPMDPESLQDPFASNVSASGENSEILNITNSSPKCQQMFNIFHPADPIAYRIEPLISPAMASLKPQALPYTKKGIFSGPAQGISGMGARVGQSVSGLWSSFTSGVASSMLNRSLGLTGEGQISSSQSLTSTPRITQRPPSSADVGNSAPRSAGGSDEAGGHPSDQPPTLIDSELETLYAGFQQRKKSLQSDESRDLGEREEWQEAEAKARRLKREEAKVRALNSNGRVDYSIQEGLLDITLIASIASHLSYWADEDVCHFMISQLLARQRIIER